MSYIENLENYAKIMRFRVSKIQTRGRLDPSQVELSWPTGQVGSSRPQASCLAKKSLDSAD